MRCPTTRWPTGISVRPGCNKKRPEAASTHTRLPGAERRQAVKPEPSFPGSLLGAHAHRHGPAPLAHHTPSTRHPGTTGGEQGAALGSMSLSLGNLLHQAPRSAYFSSCLTLIVRVDIALALATRALFGISNPSCRELPGLCRFC